MLQTGELTGGGSLRSLTGTQAPDCSSAADKALWKSRIHCNICKTFKSVWKSEERSREK